VYYILVIIYKIRNNNNRKTNSWALFLTLFYQNRGLSSQIRCQCYEAGIQFTLKFLNLLQSVGHLTFFLLDWQPDICLFFICESGLYGLMEPYFVDLHPLSMIIYVGEIKPVLKQYMSNALSYLVKMNLVAMAL
jgi:hypothetical protein